MKTTARNQFSGTIEAIQSAGSGNDEIIIDIGCGLEIVAGITQGNTRRLDLTVGQEVIALIKASWIIVAVDSDDYEFSTRNQFQSTVIAIKAGETESEVCLKTDEGIKLIAIVTNEAIENMGLTVGKKAKALFKAPHVILGIKKA
ncbi:MAG: TOBE domain-containing protein [Wohlfahrtiimonas sp.]